MSELQVLVVDDSLSARFAIQRYLEQLGVTVRTATSGGEALSQLRSHRPDAIFMDHVMPELDGLQTLARIREQPDLGAIPVVICSSNDSPDYVGQARGEGAVDVLHKPPDPSELKRIVTGLRSGTYATATGSAPEPAEVTAPQEPRPDPAAAAQTQTPSPAMPAAAPPTPAAEPPPIAPVAERPSEPPPARAPAAPAAGAPGGDMEILAARLVKLEEAVDELAAQTRSLTERIEQITDRAAEKAAEKVMRRISAALKGD